MSWENDCAGAGQTPSSVVLIKGMNTLTSGPNKGKEVPNQPQDPTGEDRQAGLCAACDHRFWMSRPNTIPPHGVPDGPRPKGTEFRELDD